MLPGGQWLAYAPLCSERRRTIREHHHTGGLAHPRVECFADLVAHSQPCRADDNGVRDDH